MSFSHLSDAELISHLTFARIASPVIEELCTRLGNSPALPANADIRDANQADEHCPVCQAKLSVEATDAGKVKFIAKGLL